MAIYSFKTPDGKIHDLEAPEGTDPRKVMAVLEQRLSSESAFRPRPVARKLGGFWDSVIESAKTFGLGDEAAAFAANPTEENRKAFIAAGDSKFRKVGFGEGENWAAFKQLLGSSLGQMAAPIAAATAGSFATPVAGIAAGVAASTGQYEIQNLLRQAQEQERAAAEGRTPEELELGKSLVASGLQAGLDVAQVGLLAKLFRAFPLTRNLVLPEKEATGQALEKIVRNYQAGTLTYKNGIARGALQGFAFEVPQEVAQQALERWQAGLSLTDDEAREEFKQAAIGAAILGPLMGGAAGTVGTARQRATAEAEQGRRGVEAARREAPPETREEVDTTEEVEPPPPPPAAPEPPVVEEEAEPAAPEEESDRLIKLYGHDLSKYTPIESDLPLVPSETGVENAVLPKMLGANERGSMSMLENYRRDTELVPVKWLNSLVGNEVDEQRVQQLTQDIQKYGLDEPLLIQVGKNNRNAILGEGNHRLEAARRLGYTHMPARVVVNDNQRGANADVDLIPQKDKYFPHTASPSQVFKSLTAPTAPEVEPVATPTPEPDVRNLALEAIKTTPTIKAIVEATGLNQPKAAAIMRGFVDEGLVERKGNKFKLVEAAKPEEAAAAPEEESKPSRAVFIHGGSNFDNIDPRMFGTGEPGGIRPLGKGLYGYFVDADSREDIDRAIKQARIYAEQFGDGTVHAFSLDLTDAGIRQLGGKYNKKLGSGTNKEFDKITSEYFKADERYYASKAPYDSPEKLELLYAKRVAEKNFKDASDVVLQRLPIDLTEAAIPERALSRLKRIGKYNADETGRLTEDINKYLSIKPKTKTPEAPRGTVPEPVAEEAVAESVGRGAELPVSRPAPEGRAVAEPRGEGLGVPSEAAVRADERAAGVEPALEAQVAETPQALSQVEEQLVHDRLSETQKRVIAQEFEQDSYNDVAKKRFIEEVIKGVNEGIKAVRARLRGIVRAVIVAMLSTGIVFNASAFNNLNPKSILVASDSTVRTAETPRPTPPAEAANAMSPAARATYERFMLDNKSMPFIIADKPSAQVFLFKADGSLIKFFPALYGKAKGDVLSRPIGKQLTSEEINNLVVNERITPAGEFTAKMQQAVIGQGENAVRTNALFLQDAQGNTGSISIHQVYTANIQQRRLERLASADVADNKISMGCINVGVDNWNNYIVPNYGKGARVGVVPDETGALDKFIPLPEVTVQYTVDKDGEPTPKPSPETPAAPKDTKARSTRPAATRRPGGPPPGGPPTPPTPPGPPPGGPPTPPTPRGPTPAAPTPPIPPRASTPQQLKRDMKRALSAAVQPLMDRPGYSDSFAKKVIDALGNVPLNLRKAQFAIYSMPQMQQLLSTVLPYIKVLEKTNGLRAAQTSSGLDRIAKNQTRWQEIIKRHPRAKWEQLKNVATLGTLYQVDPTSAVVKKLHNDVRSGTKTVASLTPVEKVQYEIAATYYSLPSDLRGILISDDGKSGIVPEYRKYRQQKFDAMVKNWTKQGIPTTVIEKLRKEFNDPQNNLSFYIPLRRDQGVYWLKYVDANGNSVSKLFSNPVERNAFRQQIEAQGATQIEETSRYSDIKGEGRGKPPTGFLGEIVELLETSLPSTMGPGKNVIISEVYDIFLDYMPQNTLRQELSSRQVLDLGAGLKQFGVFGFNEDFLETYVQEAPRIVYQLNNLRWVLPIEDVMKKLAEQRDRYIANYGNPAFMRGKLDIPPEQLNEAFDSVRKRVDFGYSPTYAPWVYNIATGNYIFSIAANVSSALINTTTIPMLAIPVLAAKYGVMPTLRAITRASTMFAKAPSEGGITVFGKRIGDWSAAHGATGEYKQFFKTLIDRGVIGAVAEQELLQAQRVQLSGYDSLGDKANYIAGYVFKNSERFNRETTLLASFMLAREKGKSFNDALEEAISNNNDVNGAVLPASDSRLYQTNLGRVLLTFRKYILNASILIAGTFKDALAKVEPNDAQQKLLRTVARRRLLGIYAGTYMVAGIGGMPLFGAAEVLAALMMGDDDEPYDLQQEVYESLGELGLNGPVNALIGLDIASRTGFTDVLWRDDPKRLAEAGYITFGLEKLAGPTYSQIMNWQRGFGLMAEGEIWRGTEALLPAAARNALKALRYANEGALTKNGVPIEKDIGLWNNTMQVFGFAPAELATTQARVGAEYQISQKLRRRRTALYTQLYAAVSAGNGDAVREAYKDIAAFNRANPTIAIDFRGEEQSFRQRDRRNAESIDGLYLEKNMRQATIPYVSSRD